MMDSVFPAQAGVIPIVLYFCSTRARIPRASGGDPGRGYADRNFIQYSPRKRG